jgi:succinate-semialdehyde dehydrogenase/glutarate-semialdehyde dehydrogenase
MSNFHSPDSEVLRSQRPHRHLPPETASADASPHPDLGGAVAPLPGTAPFTASHDPATGELLGQAPEQTVADVQRAVAEARRAQRHWAATPVRQRAAALRRVRDAIVRDADALAAIISKDNGKTRTDALVDEVLPGAAAVGYYASHAARFLGDQRLRPGLALLAYKRSRVVRVPFGVVGIISPWNYPFAIPLSEIAMALAAGNGVVLKVATQTQLVGRALARLFDEAGLPPGLFHHVNVPGRVAGPALLDAGIDKLFFTGSVGVGSQLMARAAQTLTPVSLELGGNDPMLVCADADLDRAAAGAVWAGMQNAGQTCGGVERIYVHRDVYQPFLDRLAARVRRLRVGPDRDFDVDIGAITTAAQKATIEAHVADALARGATLYAQSDAPAEGRFLPAMVLTDVTHEMRVMRQETFGPVVGVMAVGSMDEAVALANDSNLGLTASVWSRDRQAADRLARRLQAGAVTINDHTVSNGLPETPWGGFKHSGIGRTHGELGFAEMTQPQVIVHDYLPGARGNPWWHPHGRFVYSGMKGLLDLLYAPGLRRRLTGAARFTRLFARTFGIPDPE